MGNRDDGVRSRCPYQGLAPFAAENSELFFGRARATRGLIERLGRRLNGHGAILMVTGASGVGKSSLLRAGVLPALENGTLSVAGSTSARWPRLLMTPTAHPLATLAACLAGAYGDGDGGEDDVTRLRDDLREGLRDDPRAAAARLLSGRDRPVLIVDQFEELFTLVAAERERQAFAAALDALAGAPNGAAVVIGVRADYWDRCTAYPQFAEAIQDGQVIVEPMTESDLRLAITGPAAAVGLEIESGLVETILGDLRAGRDATDRYAAGTLPLLSQSLRNTWQLRRDGRLTIRGYEESGRVRDAVRHTADEVIERLPAAERTTALRVFRRLTVITTGGRVARRPATLTEIHAAVAADSAERRGQVDALVSAFADRRLLTLTEDTVEICHDALLTAWPALRRWIEPDLTAQTVYDQLIEDAAQWDEHHRDPAFLYRGARLLSVRDTRPRWDHDPDSFPPPGPTADAFVDASTRAVRRAERRRRLTMAGLAALLVVALIAAGTAIKAARDADRQRALAEGRQLAAQSQVVGDTDPATAALLAVAGWRIAPTNEARYSMLNTAARPSRGVLSGHTAPVTEVAFSPAGSVMATGGMDGTARLWDVTTRRRLGPPITHPHDDGGTNIDALAFNPAGTVLITAQLHTVRFWDVSAHDATHRASGAPLDAEDPISAMALSRDGRILATGSIYGSIRLWDVAARRQRGDPIRATDAKGEMDKVVTRLDFSPDGSRLAAAGADKTVRLWDTATGRQAGTPFTGHTGRVRDVVFSPDGTTLATTSSDGTARLWNVAAHRQSGKALANPYGHSVMAGIAFSPDGRRVVTTGDAIRLWDVARREAIGPAFPDDENKVPGTRAAFSPDGRLVATGGNDGLVRMWDPVTHEQIGSALPGVAAMAMSPAGRVVAVSGSGGTDRTMRIWDVATRRQDGDALRPADRAAVRAAGGGGKASVFGIKFGPAGTMFATHNGPDGIRLWDAATHRQLGTPIPMGGDWEFSPDGKGLAISDYSSIRFWPSGLRIAVPDRSYDFTALTFSPDGRVLAVADGGHTVWLFDRATRRPVGAGLPGATGGTYDDELAFSPDGRVLATAGEGRAARLWDVRTRREIGVPLAGHTGRVTAIAFSPDGKILATGSTDTTVRLWDLTTYRPIGVPLIGHTGAVRSIVFRPDGRTLATYGDDETARLWNVAAPADLTAAACAVAGRSLTAAEWQRYLPNEKFRRVCP